jgi:hypothetical protein
MREKRSRRSNWPRSGSGPATRRRGDRRVNDRPREDVCQSTTLFDVCGRRRSPATLPDFHQSRPPRNKGLRFPADPPIVEEIIAVMRAAGDDADAVRLRGLIVLPWRAGLPISEALALTESDLDSRRGAILVRHGKRRFRSGRCSACCEARGEGRPRAPAGARSELHITANRAGVAPGSRRISCEPAHAVEMAREGVPLLVIQRQLGYADLAITSVYLRGIDNTEIVHAVHERPAPMILATHDCRSRSDRSVLVGSCPARPHRIWSFNWRASDWRSPAVTKAARRDHRSAPRGWAGMRLRSSGRCAASVRIIGGDCECGGLLRGRGRLQAWVANPLGQTRFRQSRVSPASTTPAATRAARQVTPCTRRSPATIRPRRRGQRCPAPRQRRCPPH